MSTQIGYYSYYNDRNLDEIISCFKLIPVSQYGYDFLEGNVDKTIHWAHSLLFQIYINNIS